MPSETDLINQALVLQHDNKPEAACEVLQAALTLNPDNSELALLLGSLLVKLQHFRQALVWLEKVLAGNPVRVDALAFKAHALASLQQWNDACKVFKRLIRFRNDSYEIHSNYSQVLRSLGEFDKAVEHADIAVALNPSDASLWLRKGMLLQDMYLLAPAVTAYREALQLQPDYQPALNNLCVTYTKMNQLDSALGCLDKMLELDPGSVSGLANKASLLLRMGDVEQALTFYEQARAIDPESEHLIGIQLFAMNFIATPDPQRVLELANRYRECLARKIALQYNGWLCPRDTDVLRIGVVSGDLRKHPVGYFSEAVFSELSKHRVELHAFTTNRKKDELTMRLEPHFKSWTSLHKVRPAMAARRIHDTGVHILIDLSGHTDDNLLPVFGYKPAPIQVSWLGYFATTGMTSIDYFLCSDSCAPDGEQAHFTEQLARLTPCHLCFTPPECVVDVNPLPVQKTKVFTFGCFNKRPKLNGRVLDVWSRILKQVPNSRLLLKASEFGSEQVREKMFEEFGQRGIKRERLLLEGSSPYEDMLRRYRDVDLVLDPFPFPGGTTSVEAMWMGVPVLTLAGTTLLSRQGEALAHAANQHDWVARDEDDYVSKACYHTRQKAKLARLRAGLRKKILQSPLFDAPTMASELERTFRLMWQQWQNQQRS